MEELICSQNILKKIFISIKINMEFILFFVLRYFEYLIFY